jgi:murein DD-endopeptidase MepM/ murein hydrolase activator NlpD
LLFKRFSLMLVPEGGRVRRLQVSPRLVGVLGAALALLMAFGIWGGWQVIHGQEKDQQILALKNQLAIMQGRHEQKVERMQSRIEADRRQLAIYARNIGNMQARLARLDALGSELVEVASLDASEFNFGLQPAYGGPRITQSPAVDLGGMGTSLKLLNTRLSNVDAQLAAIDFLLQQQREEAAARPHAWPTENGWVSSGYGMRTDPFTGERASHRGVDIANRFGAPVLAGSRGIVTFAGKVKDYGYMIEIDHGYGYMTRYGHLSGIVAHVGDEVSDGQLIGRTGSTGRSTGPHLHYEVHRYGRHLNPDSFLPRG